MNQAAVEDRIERGQAGIAQQSAMEIPVGLGELILILGTRRALHGIDQVLQIGDEGSASMPDSLNDGAALDGLPQPKHLHRFIGGAVRNPGAAMSLPHDEALLLWLEKCLADRSLAAAEPRGEFEFDQRLADRQLAQHDFPFERIEHLTRPGRAESNLAVSA